MLPPKPYREERPWGNFVKFTQNLPSTVKIITVKPNETLSLQTHSHRDEFWQVVSGDGSVDIGPEHFHVKAGDSHFVPRTTAHRIASGPSGLTILEIAFGDFDENDIVRLEDKYGRT